MKSQVELETWLVAKTGAQQYLIKNAFKLILMHS